MGDIFQIMRFGLPYLRRYWVRFGLGILFGFLFGLSNGLTMGSVYLMIGRLSDSAHVARVTQQAKDARHAQLDAAQQQILDERKKLDDAQAQLKAERDQLDAEESAAHELPAAHAFRAWAERWTGPTSRAVHAWTEKVRGNLYLAVDPWLPLANRPIDWKQFLGGFLIFPLIAGIRGLANYATVYCMAWAGQRISNDIRVDVFRKISSFSLDFYHRHTTAELMSRVLDDPGAVNTCLKMGLSDMIKEPSTIVVLFTTLLYIDWKLTLLALIFIPLCVIPTRTVSRRIKAQGREDNIAGIQQSSTAVEAFQNVRVTKAYNLVEAQAQLFRKWGNRAGHYVMKATQSRAMLNPVIETLNAFGMGAVILYAIWRGVKIEVLSSFLLALVLFFQPFKKLSTVQVYFTQAGLAIERLMALMAEEPNVPEPAHPREMAPFARSLEFRDVSFSYGDGPVLEHINIEVPRGMRLGLAGESGSGKSSMLNLLFRFYDPTGGSITLDGAPIDAFRLADLRGQFALVSQDVLLFNTTVAENIGYGKAGATREEIIAAARQAHAHEFISALPQGYDTPLGERGQRLSGGQRQRIAIARAFVRNAPILVLDEATAALDAQSEAEVQKAIEDLAENRTVICVAHRLSTLRSMDRILVLQRGRVVESGRFDELLARGGLFAGMAARQSILPQVAVA
jgi:subfamily B ATP-binding cassette protein MsbA